MPSVGLGAVRSTVRAPGIGIHVEIEIGNRPGDIARRHWNRIAKEAIRDELLEHHKKRIPLHFRQDAFYRYGYKERNPKYRRYKERRWGSRRALVKTGDSEKLIRADGKITIGGAAEGGKYGLAGKLTMRFAWPGGLSESSRRITNAQMKQELRAIRPDERDDIVLGIWRRMNDKLQQFRAQRKRRRLPTI